MTFKDFKGVCREFIKATDKYGNCLGYFPAENEGCEFEISYAAIKNATVLGIKIAYEGKAIKVRLDLDKAELDRQLEMKRWTI